jgi:putative transposase
VLWGRLSNLRPIVNRPTSAILPRIPPLEPHSPCVHSFHARRLPHLHAIGRPIFLTWRLDGSLPAGRHFPSTLSSGQAFVAMDRLLDNARTGPLYLRQPEIAKLVMDAILHHERELNHYELHAYVIMANHVHLLVTPRVAVSKFMQSLKKFTALQANRILGLTGQPFWQDESYDRLVRGDDEFRRIARYIEMNPVRAGVAPSPEEFRWSSSWPIDNRPQV